MFNKERHYRAKRFDMQDSNDIAEFEKIKNKVLVERESGWAIIGQTSFSNKHGDVFVLMEWIET